MGGGGGERTCPKTGWFARHVVVELKVRVGVSCPRSKKEYVKQRVSGGTYYLVRSKSERKQEVWILGLLRTKLYLWRPISTHTHIPPPLSLWKPQWNPPFPPPLFCSFLGWWLNHGDNESETDPPLPPLERKRVLRTKDASVAVATDAILFLFFGGGGGRGCLFGSVHLLAGEYRIHRIIHRTNTGYTP